MSNVCTFFWATLYITIAQQQKIGLCNAHTEFFSVPANAAVWYVFLNPLNADLNPICRFLASLEARHILHVSRKQLTQPQTGYCYFYGHSRTQKVRWMTPKIVLKEIRVWQKWIYLAQVPLMGCCKYDNESSSCWKPKNCQRCSGSVSFSVSSFCTQVAIK